MSQVVDVKTAADLLGHSQRHVIRLCRSGKLAGAAKAGGRWQIPVAADTRLRGIVAVDDIGTDELINVPVKKRNQALTRLGLINEFESFAGSFVRNGGSRSDAAKIFAKEKGLAWQTLYRWISNHRANGVIGLVDMRGGAFKADTFSADAGEYFKALFLTTQQLTVKQCWQMMCYHNKATDQGWTVPGLRYMYNWVKDNIPLPSQVLHREGLAAYEAKCAPYIEKDPDSVKAGQIFIGDHHQCNCWVRHRNTWVRPWITAWEDMGSRAIVGIHVSASPNQTTILLAMKRAIEKYGPPESVKIDNGKDYDSEMWTGQTKAKRKALRARYIDEPMVAGIYAMLDIGVSFSIPYHPQSKPVERFFDTLDRQIINTIPTYCNKDPMRRSDDLGRYLKTDKAVKAAYSLESFAELADKYMHIYNHTNHTALNATPASSMAARPTRRVVMDGVLDLLLRVWSGELKVGKNGVRFKGLNYGQYDAALLGHQGKKVRIAYDPDALQQIYVYDAVTLKLLTVAEQNQLIRYGADVSEDALRQASRQKARALKAVKSAAGAVKIAKTDLPDLALNAMADAMDDKPTDDNANAVIRPVATVMDDQVKIHQAIENRARLRRAVGAEELDLNFNFSDDNTLQDTDVDLNFNFKGKQEKEIDLGLL